MTSPPLKHENAQNSTQKQMKPTIKTSEENRTFTSTDVALFVGFVLTCGLGFGWFLVELLLK